VGALHLDFVHCEATFEGCCVDLTRRSSNSLRTLPATRKVCTRRMILEHVWGPAYAKELHYLKVYAYRIRRKLGDDAGAFCRAILRGLSTRHPRSRTLRASGSALGEYVGHLCSIPCFLMS